MIKRFKKFFFNFFKISYKMKAPNCPVDNNKCVHFDSFICTKKDNCSYFLK